MLQYNRISTKRKAKDIQGKKFPQNHLFRKKNKLVDFSFIREE